MPNKNYVAGRRKEYKICNEYKRKGFDIVQRTAGSHSPIDVFAINRVEKKIVFIQSKPNNFEISKSKQIKAELEYLNDEFTCSFLLV